MYCLYRQRENVIERAVFGVNRLRENVIERVKCTVYIDRERMLHGE